MKCIVDQSDYAGEEDAPQTSYYQWVTFFFAIQVHSYYSTSGSPYRYEYTATTSGSPSSSLYRYTATTSGSPYRYTATTSGSPYSYAATTSGSPYRKHYFSAIIFVIFDPCWTS